MSRCIFEDETIRRASAESARIPCARSEKQGGRSLVLLSTRYKVTDGLYSLVRRLMIPLAAVFVGILQHSHSTGFRSGATARIIFPPSRSAYGFKIGCGIVVPASRAHRGAPFASRAASLDNRVASCCFDLAPKLLARKL